MAQTDTDTPVSSGTLDTSDMGTSAGATGSVGHRLSELRKERGLSIADVAQVIKYTPRQIEALERDQFDQLPDAVIVRGFIRNYARLLQVDATGLLSTFNRQVPERTCGIEVPPTTGASLPQAGWRDEPWRMIMVPGGVFVVIVLLIATASFFLWPAKPSSSKESAIETAVAASASPGVVSSGSHVGTNAQGAQGASSPASTAHPVDTSAPTSTLIGQGVAPKDQTPSSSVRNVVNDPALRQLMFSFDDKAWVEVKDATQRTIFAQSNPPGTHQVVSGKPPFTIVVGNAPRVQLEYEERLVDMQPYTKVDVARFTLE